MLFVPRCGRTVLRPLRCDADAAAVDCAGYRCLHYRHLDCQKLTDPACYGMMFNQSVFGIDRRFPAISFVTYGIGFWSPPFMQRFHGETIADAACISVWVPRLAVLLASFWEA